MPTGRKVWLGLLLAGGAYELRGIFRPGMEDTLSEFTRWAFQTHTDRGRLAFGSLWPMFALWFYGHILRRRREVELKDL